MENKDYTGILFLFAIIFAIFKIFQNKVELSGVSNEETWEIERDEKGRIKDIIIHRKVQPNINQSNGK